MFECLHCTIQIDDAYVADAVAICINLAPMAVCLWTYNYYFYARMGQRNGCFLPLYFSNFTTLDVGVHI